MFDCTLMLVRCMVVFGSSIACFTTVLSFAPPAGACSEFAPGVVGRECSAAAPMDGEGQALPPAVFYGWIRLNARNKG